MLQGGIELERGDVNNIPVHLPEGQNNQLVLTVFDPLEEGVTT